MMFLCLFCLAVTASALPTLETTRNVIFTQMGPSGVTPDKKGVEFMITPQETGFKAKPENGFYIPKAPQLSPLYLFTLETPKFPEGNKDGDKKDNGEDKKPEEGKGTEEKYQLERYKAITQILEPAVLTVINGLNEILSLIFSSDREEEKRSYYVVMTR